MRPNLRRVPHPAEEKKNGPNISELCGVQHGRSLNQTQSIAHVSVRPRKRTQDSRPPPPCCNGYRSRIKLPGRESHIHIDPTENLPRGKLSPHHPSPAAAQPAGMKMLHDLKKDFFFTQAPRRAGHSTNKHEKITANATSRRTEGNETGVSSDVTNKTSIGSEWGATASSIVRIALHDDHF